MKSKIDEKLHYLFVCVRISVIIIIIELYELTFCLEPRKHEEDQTCSLKGLIIIFASFRSRKCLLFNAKIESLK